MRIAAFSSNEVFRKSTNNIFIVTRSKRSWHAWKVKILKDLKDRDHTVFYSSRKTKTMRTK